VIDEATGGPVLAGGGPIAFPVVFDANTGAPLGGAFPSPIDGSFSSTNVYPPGDYIVGAFFGTPFTPGVVQQNYVTEYYDDAHTREDATVITITDSTDVTGVVIDLVPQLPRIEGAVVDAATGAPLQFANVGVIDTASLPPGCGNQVGFQCVSASTYTNAAGSFGMLRPPGSYKIVVAKSGYIGELYDDATSVDDATQIELVDGTLGVTGLTVELEKLRVLGSVTDDVTGLPIAGAEVTAVSSTNSATVLGTATTAADGTYSIPVGVLAELRVHIADPLRRYHDEWYDDQPSYDVAAKFNTSFGVDLLADAALTPAGSRPAISAVGFGDSDAAVFGRSPEGGLWYRESSGGEFGDWTEIVESDVASSPAAARVGSDVLVAFRASDGSVHYVERTGSSWSDEHDLGGVTVGAPRVAVDGDGDLLVSVLNGDGVTFVNRRGSGGSWSGWSPLDGVLVGHVELASDGTDVDLVGRNEAGAYWTRHFTADTDEWGPWQPLDGVLRSAPSAAASADGLHVFGVNTDGILFTRVRSLSEGTWSDWAPLDGVLASDPSAVATDDDVLVFGVNPGAALFDRRLESDVWGGWNPLDGVLLSGPETVAAGDDAYVFALNPDGNLWYRRWDGSSFGPWTNLSGILAFE